VGQPQDGNARLLADRTDGGPSGHAGLFGSADALWRYAREWLEPTVLPASGVRDALAGAGPFLLGWARPAAWESLVGTVRERCFGALGFTGGSVWIDAEAQRLCLLLGHRADPLSDLGPLRCAYYAAALEV
jgi:hypothetical protein